MNPNQTAAFKSLEEAQQALKSGDNNTARKLAEQATQLAPELEEVWLLMAALSTPRDSLAFLEKALVINPNSERAKKGLQWALERSSQEPGTVPVVAEPAPTEPQPEAPGSGWGPGGVFDFDEPDEAGLSESFSPATEEPIEPQPEQVEPAGLDGTMPEPIGAFDFEEMGEVGSTEAPTAPDKPKKPVSRQRISLITVLGILVLGLLIWGSFQEASPVAAFFTNIFSIREHGPSWLEVNFPKAGGTQSNASPTSAEAGQPSGVPLLVSPTATLHPLPSVTAALPGSGFTSTPGALQASETAVLPNGAIQPASETPLPASATPTPAVPAPARGTETLEASPTPDLSPTEQPSPTPLPTDTDVPLPGQASQTLLEPLPTPSPIAAVPDGSTGRWIDVDLQRQTVYAYDGTSLVKSFLASSGTAQYPTVTGQFHIYIKYLFKNMTGPGYFLPDVPFTMFFYQSYALHGTYWHHNFGTPMSHGCVNLSTPDSEWIYGWASVGTLVNVHN
jgi:lipoprotein-anchoring transpeptidase ErfK/SrfK